MELKAFVAETLQQIVAGVLDAQKQGEGCAAINAETGMSQAIPTSSHLFVARTGMFTTVNFDVAVSAESSGGGRASLQVFSLGSAEGGGERKNASANRISFSVPIQLPAGAPMRNP